MLADKLRGQRGEWYVAAQAVILALIAYGPSSLSDAPDWPAPFHVLGKVIGGALAIAGFVFVIFASLKLGKSLTPLPHPRDDAVLTVSGPYRLVRHPIYSGLIIASFGWALWLNGWLTLVYAVILFIFFDIKSRREETWLMARYPEYAAYQQRVSKLIPFAY